MTTFFEGLADLVTMLHVAFSGFVLLGFFAIFAGLVLRFRWADGPGLRFAHAAAVLFIAARSWLGVPCPLTAAESGLRAWAGSAERAPSAYVETCHKLFFHGADQAGFQFSIATLAAATIVMLAVSPPRPVTAPRRGTPPSAPGPRARP